MTLELAGFEHVPWSTQVDAPVQCARCGRVLKNPKSIARGIGPTCARKVEADAEAEFARLVKEREGAQTRLAFSDAGE